VHTFSPREVPAVTFRVVTLAAAVTAAADALAAAGSAIARRRRRWRGAASRTHGERGVAPAGPSAPVPVVDVVAVVADAIDGAELPASIAVRPERPRHAVFAAADARALRDGLRALLRVAAAAMPAGGELRVAVARHGSRVVVELADSGAPSAAAAALEPMRALLARCGAKLSRDGVPGRGNRWRVTLPAPAPPPLRGRPAHSFDRLRTGR
jgi:hypothetical protein